MKSKILLIEDEPDILEVIQYNLEREGHKVVACRNGEQGLSRIRTDNPDLVILDIMLPGMDGVEVCRQVKSDPITRSIPVIMVTAKSEESDVVLGLGIGADDYISKPFSPRELVARVKVVLRRGPLRDQSGGGERVVRGSLAIDLGRHEARLADQLISLTPTEMRLLHFLASHPGRVFPRAHLLSRVIGEDAIVTDRNIDVHVRSLRQKLGEHADFIETVRGVGYRFADAAK
ncbi:MAG TPA: response regulator [Planctomycetota bacterium]|nr:response regulator [Planctomycetota bacterium]